MAGSQTPPVGPTPPPVGGGPVALDRASAKRTEEAVKYIEREVRNVTPGYRRPGGGICPGVLAVTGGSAIAAGGFTAPTSGTVTLRAWSGSALSADTGNTVTAWNYHDKIIAAGSLVFLSWALGEWWITDVRSCTNLS